MGRHAGEYFRLRTALRGLASRPPRHVAILLMETGALECVEMQGDPRFIERRVIVRNEEIRRTLTSRYVRTDLIAQGGYRVYTLHEVISSDVSIEEVLCHQNKFRRSPEDIAARRTLAQKKGIGGKVRVHPRCEVLRDEISRLSDEERDDES